MKSQVIPAQITTVEDKIAGNLNLTQITLLMLPAFWTVVVYAVFAPRLQISLYKLPLILLVLISCLVLALRIKDKVVFNWLTIIFRYNIRPKYYLFNKNDNYLKIVDLPTFEKKRKVSLKRSHAKKQSVNEQSSFSIAELVKLEGLLANPKYSFTFKSTKKGGLNVAFEQEQK